MKGEKARCRSIEDMSVKCKEHNCMCTYIHMGKNIHTRKFVRMDILKTWQEVCSTTNSGHLSAQQDAGGVHGTFHFYLNISASLESFYNKDIVK